MADKVCIKKGCNWTRTHGYFCQKHRVPEQLVDARTRCAAIGCSMERKSLTLFCPGHQRSIDRDAHTFYSPLDATAPGFRAPLPDLKCKFVVDPKRKPISRDKLLVRWRADQRRYEATCRTTNVVGHGATPGDAIRDWQYWWDIPF